MPDSTIPAQRQAAYESLKQTRATLVAISGRAGLVLNNDGMYFQDTISAAWRSLGYAMDLIPHEEESS